MYKSNPALLIIISIKKVEHTNIDYIHRPFKEHLLLLDWRMQKVSSEGKHQLWIELLLPDLLHLQVQVINL